MTRLPSGVAETLVRAAQELTLARDDWWLVGGAAVALHGVAAVEIADIDILLSPRDARRILAALNISRDEGGGVDRFRSDVFGRWTGLPLSIDLMAGLQVRTGEAWTRIEPATREAILVEGHPIYVPSRVELIRYLSACSAGPRTWRAPRRSPGSARSAAGVAFGGGCLVSEPRRALPCRHTHHLGARKPCPPKSSMRPSAEGVGSSSICRSLCVALCRRLSASSGYVPAG